GEAEALAAGEADALADDGEDGILGSLLDRGGQVPIVVGNFLLGVAPRPEASDQRSEVTVKTTGQRAAVYTVAACRNAKVLAEVIGGLAVRGQPHHLPLI